MQGRQRLNLVSLFGMLLGCATAAFAQGTVVATPNQLNLDNTTGSDVIRTVTLTTTSTTPISFTTPSQPTSWLMVKPVAGSVVAGSPVVLTMEANAAQLDTGTTYNILVPINSGGQTLLQIPVYFNVEVVTGLMANPSGVGWTYAIGGAVPPQQPVTLITSASTFSASATSTGSWLQLTVPNAGPLFTPQSELGSFPTSQGLVLVFNSLAEGLLSPGTGYTGTVTVTDGNQNVSIITVNLSVLSSGSAFTVSQGSLTLTSTGATATATLNLFSPNPTQFNATTTVNTPPGGSWLTVTSNGISPQPVTVTANPAGLSTGSYQGSITFVAGGLSAVVQVTFVVSVPVVTGGNVVSNRPSLSFGYVIGGGSPPTQTINITDQIGSAAIPFTVSASSPAGTNWLSAVVAGGGTQGITGSTSAAVIVSVNPLGLSPGNYSGGTINITPAGGNVLGIPVTFQVTGQSSVSASPLQLSFSYQIGSSAPTPLQVQVTGTSPNLPFAVVTATQSGGNWLASDAFSGLTPATPGVATTLNISVAPGQLGQGSYQGTITVAGTGSASGTTTIQVVLTVTAVFPSITSVVNAASFLGGAVSPGEIVTIFGTNLGPFPPVGTTLDSTGKVSTNIGNTQVLFNGTPAPLTYVSSTQINCVVPYEFALITSNGYVQVKYQGQSSNVFNLQETATNPAIFAASKGIGQGAILNGDNSTNGSGTGAAAAAKGSTVQLYMTGEGLLSPQPATGSVTCPGSGCTSLSQIPVPQAKVAVLVNNQPATYTFAGEGPGFVSGVLQVDVTIPPNTPSGSIPITVTVGGVASQAGITVLVQ